MISSSKTWSTLGKQNLLIFPSVQKDNNESKVRDLPPFVREVWNLIKILNYTMAVIGTEVWL